jgi:hypothetical protein
LATSAHTISPATWDRVKEANAVSGTISRQPEQTALEARKNDLFMQDARERFRISVNASDRQRREMRDDLRFYAGIQWDESIRAVRDQQGRPCLTINRIPGFVSHVVNNMRQQRPGIKVDPIAGGADEEMADVREGLMRHIEISSHADIAYDTAFENMCITGLGYIRVIDAWADPRSVVDQELRVEWVPNSFSVFEDPTATQPGWRDGKYRFIVEDITLTEFRHRFGKERSPASLSEFTALGTEQPYWMLGDKIRIAEYFHIEEEDDTLFELNDGSGVYESELSEDDPRISEIKEDGSGGWVSRPAKRKRVMWTQMYGLGVLRQREWPGRYIPVIPIIGNQIELEGERIIVGMVRYARESQRMFNYMYSSFVETCALAPRAPYIAEFTSVEDFIDSYKNANTNPQSVLLYKQRSVDGAPVNPPRREVAEPPIQAFVAGLKLADDNLKAIFRIYDASLGQKGPQESGIAINSRKIESDLATYDWIDNFTRGLRCLGEVLEDLLPHYYNRPGRVLQILQEDLQRKIVTIGKPVDQSDDIYDLNRGKFATTVSTGPMLSTRRQEAAKSMIELAKVYPALMQACGPMIIREMDWPGKDAIAAQLEKTLPPQLRQQDPDAPKDDPEQLKQTLNQAMQQIQVLSKLVTEASDKKTQEYQKEWFETIRAEMANQTAIETAMIKAKTAEVDNLYQRLEAELQRIHDIGMVAIEQQPQSSAPAGQAAAPQVPPSGANTPTGVGTGQ